MYTLFYSSYLMNLYYQIMTTNTTNQARNQVQRLCAYSLFLVLTILATASSAAGQSLKAYEKAANDAYETQDYYNAAQYYEMVLESKKKTDIYYKFAESSRLTYSYGKAVKAYEWVLRDNKEKINYPLAEFHYATCLKHLARYDDAFNAFTSFLSKYPTQDFNRQRATQELQSCTVAKILANTPNDSIIISSLGKNINTEYSDFAGSEKHNAFFYSSLHFKTEEPKNPKSKVKPRSRLVAKMLRSDSERDSSVLLESLNSQDMHAANLSWSPDGNTVFFTRCTGEKADSIKCAIWTANYDQATKTFLNPRRLPDNVNNNAATNTHPHIAYMADLDKSFLFFSSDRPGGQGNLDIWAVEWKGEDSWGVPFNLGRTLNSVGDESTPFFHPATQYLYFSSDWHHGMGGFDIFKSKRIGNTIWQVPENIGLPYNSAANDLYFIINPNDTSGYLASNRIGSMILSGEACCNDIYRFGYKSNKQPDTPTTIVKIDTPKVDTPKVDTPIVVKVDTPKVDTPIVVKVDTPKVDTPIVVKVDTPKVDTPIVVKVDTPKVDTPKVIVKVDTPPANTDLTRKIEELNKMLPLTLYFHNDEPDSNTTATTTDKPYDLPYQDYIGMKQTYKEQHTAQFGVEKQPLVLKKIDDFFELDVKGEYNRMNFFFDKMLELLEAGASLDLTIKGYTSPRSSEGYNQALARRRITSVRKQLFIYKNGVFLRYFQAGKLSVSNQPIGESQAPKGISDDIQDPQNSVFSVEAAKERRAEIIVIQRKK
jgi:tetratricopeptide (TPR) repeat protein